MPIRRQTDFAEGNRQIEFAHNETRARLVVSGFHLSRSVHLINAKAIFAAFLYLLFRNFTEFFFDPNKTSGRPGVVCSTCFRLPQILAVYFRWL